MSDIGEFTLRPIEDSLSPPIVSEVRETIDEGPCRFSAIDWNQDVDPKNLYELVGERGIMDWNDGIISSTPEAGIPGCSRR
jgi:hypothetical protein